MGNVVKSFLWFIALNVLSFMLVYGGFELGVLLTDKSVCTVIKGQTPVNTPDI